MKSTPKTKVETIYEIGWTTFSGFEGTSLVQTPLGKEQVVKIAREDPDIETVRYVKPKLLHVDLT